jgi:cell division protease FtsH
VFGHDHSQPFLGREFSSEPDYSDEIAREIDDEIRRVVESAHQRAKDILTEHRETLNTVSEILVRRETIEKAEFEALIAGKSEEEVFPEEVATPQLPPPAVPVDQPGRDAPRTLPRPGLAGGLEARGEEPRKPAL